MFGNDGLQGMSEPKEHVKACMTIITRSFACRRRVMPLKATGIIANCVGRLKEFVLLVTRTRNLVISTGR